MIVTSTHYGYGKGDAEAAGKWTDWECKPGSVAGLCYSSREVVNIKNCLSDERFPHLSYKSLGRIAVSCLSQVFIPVFSSREDCMEAGGAECGKEAPIVAIIRLLNKVTLDGSQSGMPFERRDEIMGRVYGSLILEVVQVAVKAKEGVMPKSFMSKLGKAMARERVRRSVLTDMTPIGKLVSGCSNGGPLTVRESVAGGEDGEAIGGDGEASGWASSADGQASTYRPAIGSKRSNDLAVEDARPADAPTDAPTDASADMPHDAPQEEGVEA